MVKADPYPLRQILAQERQYVIPTFQRNYEWTEAEQWELLADDLEAVAERLGQERHHAEITGGNPASADERVSPHFLGAVVLDRLPPSKAGGLDLRSVIDGQQRLTTLQLLVRSLLDVATDHDSPKARQLRRLLRNPDDVSDGHEVHKLWPRRRDRDVWVDVMSDNPAGEPKSHKYLESRAYFAKRVRNAVAEAEDPAATLDLIVDSCLEMFRIVLIDLDDNDDAQVIFEVLNGRQTALSSADLVKNLLFLRAEQQQVGDVEKLYDDYWDQFDDEWWTQNVGRGHATRQHTNVMLSAWLTVASGEAAHPDRLYGQVRRYMDAGNVKVPDILADVSAYAGHYRAFQAEPSEADHRVEVAFERLRVLGTTTALPPLLWIREQATTGRIDADEYRRAVLDVESYVLRRVAVGANTRGYGLTFREVLAVARAHVDAGGNPAHGIRDALVGLDGSASWPTDNDIYDAFATRKFYDNVAQYVIKLLLAGIEEQMRAETPKVEKAVVAYDELTIEHLLPQTWRTHWPVHGDGAERVVAEQERDLHTDRIGNLTLINGSLNSSQSNKTWDSKRAELERFSSLRLNADLVQNPAWSTWSETTITLRAAALAEVACRVWSRPD